MTKKIFLISAIVLALSLAFRMTISNVYNWYYYSTALSNFKPSGEQIALLVCGIIGAIWIIVALVKFVKDYKKNEQWNAIFGYAVFGIAILILSNLIINGILFFDSLESVELHETEEFKRAYIGQFAFFFVEPIVMIVLLVLSHISRKKITEDE